MRQTVYIDVLFCVNFIIDYIMLVSVRHVMSLKARRIRLLLSAALGGIFSLILLLPPVSFILSVIMSIAEAVIMAAAKNKALLFATGANVTLVIIESIAAAVLYKLLFLRSNDSSLRIFFS